MSKLFVKLLDRITISQTVWNKAMFITLSDLSREWYAMLIGRVEFSPNPNNPLVNNIKIFVDDLLVPEQRVSGADVRIEQEATQALLTDQVLMTMSQNNQRIVGWLHSHCRMGVFLSGTDLSNINDELSMLPFAVSIVVAFSSNSEYQPEKSNNKKAGISPSKRRIRALQKIEKAREAKIIAPMEFDELKRIITENKSWKKPFKEYLAKRGISLKTKRTKKESSKVNLEYYFNTGAIRSKAHGNTEFHMGVWFSHRAPFSEDKLTSRDLASHDVIKATGHQVIDWPKQRPRQLKELTTILSMAETTEIEELMKERIKSRFRPTYEPAVQPYSRITRFLEDTATGGSGVKAKISHVFASTIENLISRTKHFSRYTPTKPKVPKPMLPEPSSVMRVQRDNFCPLCGHDMDFDHSWACDLNCDVLRKKFAFDLGIEPEQLPESKDHLDPDLEAELHFVMTEAYLDGDCENCIIREETELVCGQCDKKFDISGSQSDVSGLVCEYCGNQLLYLYHILDPLNNYVGVVALCEACGEKFVSDWTTGLLVPVVVWQDGSMMHHDYQDYGDSRW